MADADNQTWLSIKDKIKKLSHRIIPFGDTSPPGLDDGFILKPFPIPQMVSIIHTFEPPEN